MTYHTSAGPERGPIFWREMPGIAIGIVAAPDNPEPIGRALPTSWDAEGRSRFRLFIHRIELAGRWSVVDRKFVPADPPGPRSSR